MKLALSMKEDRGGKFVRHMSNKKYLVGEVYFCNYRRLRSDK